MKKQAVTLLFSLAICFSFCNFAKAQIVATKTSDAFLAVPAETRERLKERLEMLISFQKAKEYGKLYELMSEDTKKSNSKESFVKVYETADQKALNTLLLRFMPNEVYLLYPDYYWMVKGCGEYVDDKKKKRLESQIEAVYENDDWYFSSLITVSGAFGIKAKKCLLNQ